MDDWLVGLALVVVGVALSGLSYRLGARHRIGVLLPWSLLEELTFHKIRCCGEDSERVCLELAAHLKLGREEAESLVRDASAKREKASWRPCPPDR